MILRNLVSSDAEAIKKLHLKSFGKEGGEVVSQLAVELIKESNANLSLVAVEEKAILGHIVFSPVKILQHDNISSFILAPLAVWPSKQRQGVGSQLIQFGLQALSNKADAVFVYGDPSYYGRHGFRSTHQVKPSYPLAYPEAWQVKELRGGVLKGVSDAIECVPALMSSEYW